MFSRSQRTFLFDGEFSLNIKFSSSLMGGSVLLSTPPAMGALVENEEAYKQHNQVSIFLLTLNIQCKMTLLKLYIHICNWMVKYYRNEHSRSIFLTFAAKF